MPEHSDGPSLLEKLEDSVSEHVEAERNMHAAGMDKTLYDVQVGIAKGAYGFGKDLVTGVIDLAIFFVKVGAGDAEANRKVNDAVVGIAKFAYVDTFGTPEQKRVQYARIAAFAVGTFRAIKRAVVDDWRQAKENGKEAEVISKWSTRGVLEVAALFVGAGEVKAAAATSKATEAVSLSKAVRLSEAVVQPCKATEVVKTASETAKALEAEAASLRTYGDALREVLGPGRISHAEEWTARLQQAEEMGVEIVYRKGTLAYEPAVGRPGRLIIDPDGSIGALRHEFQHILDDSVLGHPGLRIIADPDAFWRLEFRGYMQEIQTARRTGNFQTGRSIVKEMRARRLEILGK